MAKVRAKTLDCPNCGAPVHVRNIFKAKTVMCTNCDSQLDLTSPAFDVLAAQQKRVPPDGAICLGLKGALPDGRALEIIGRLRFVGSDDEESWHWDEWLMLVENGEYLWLSEDAGTYEIQTPYIPDNPPEISDIQTAYSLEIDGTAYRTRERGSASIDYVEGELTWKASPGGRIGYVDLRGPGGGVGIEYTAEEIEFFKRKRLSRREMYDMVGLGELIALEEKQVENQAAYASFANSLNGSGVLMLLAAFASCVVFLMGSSFDRYVASGATGTVLISSLESTQELGSAKLDAGSIYTITLKGNAQPGLSQAFVTIVSPKMKPYTVLKIDNLQKKGPVQTSIQFQAEDSGEHRVTMRGKGASGIDVSQAAFSSTSMNVVSNNFNASVFCAVGPAFLFGGLLMFMFGSSRRRAAYAQAAREFREGRATLIERLQRESRVQE